MAYESVLNITPAISAGRATSTLSYANGFDGTIYLQTSATTLGVQYSDLIAVLNFNTDTAAASLSALSASAGGGAITLALSSSSASLVTQTYSGSVISSSLPGTGTSAQLGLAFSDVNYRTTAIYLSANSTSNSVVFDTTKTSTLDNPFFIVNTGPQNVRTTSGHARIVQTLG